MQNLAADFLRRVRTIIEAAEQGLVKEDDLATGRNAMNTLLEQDWLMPRAVSDVSIHWKRIEECLRSLPERRAEAQISTEGLEAAWCAYRNIEDVFKDHLE
jgi:hypothetical protein